VRLGFTAPNEVPVYRKEIYDRIKNELQSEHAKRDSTDHET